MTDGLLLEVRADEKKSEATAAVAAGATSVPVENLTPFDDDDGGRVDIAGTQYDYLGTDESTVNADGEGGSVLLASALTADVAEFDPVSVIVAGQVAVDVVAVVDLGEDDTDGAYVEVPLDTREERLAWPIRVYDPPLPVTVADDLSTIIAAPSISPDMDATQLTWPSIYVAKGSDSPIPSSTWTKVPGWFNLQSDRITVVDDVFYIAEDGTYDLRFGVTWAASSVGARSIRIGFRDSFGNLRPYSREVKVDASPTVGTAHETSQFRSFQAGQSVWFEVWQNTGADLNLRGSQVLTENTCTDAGIRWVGQR